MKKTHPNLRSVNQLVADGFLVPNRVEPECLEQLDDKLEIVYIHEDVAVDNFYLSENEEGEMVVTFCSPDGSDYLHEHEAELTETVFAVYNVKRDCV